MMTPAPRVGPPEIRHVQGVPSSFLALHGDEAAFAMRFANTHVGGLLEPRMMVATIGFLVGPFRKDDFGLPWDRVELNASRSSQSWRIGRGIGEAWACNRRRTSSGVALGKQCYSLIESPAAHGSFVLPRPLLVGRHLAKARWACK